MLVAEWDRRQPAPSVHSPDPALAAATKLGIKWNRMLGSLIVAIRGGLEGDQHDQEAIGVAHAYRRARRARACSAGSTDRPHH